MGNEGRQTEGLYQALAGSVETREKQEEAGDCRRPKKERNSSGEADATAK